MHGYVKHAMVCKRRGFSHQHWPHTFTKEGTASAVARASSLGLRPLKLSSLIIIQRRRRIKYNIIADYSTPPRAVLSFHS